MKEKRHDTEVENAIKQLAKNNRKHPTDAERILWRYLRRRALMGCKFRRQHKIDTYIVDFVCIEKMLVIELDGRHHETPECFALDEQRSEVLRKLGFRVVRFWNRQVFFERDSVINAIIGLVNEESANTDV